MGVKIYNEVDLEKIPKLKADTGSSASSSNEELESKVKNLETKLEEATKALEIITGGGVDESN